MKEKKNAAHAGIFLAILAAALYAVAPFIGTLLSLAVFREIPGVGYFAALLLMAVGAWLCAKDEPIFGKHRKGSQNRAK